MSEKYFNAYVDAAVGSIHEYVALTLQLKAQLRVANELLAEKDQSSAGVQAQIEAIENEKNAIIAGLHRQIEDVKNESKRQVDSVQNTLNQVLSDRTSSSTTLEKEVNSLRGKLREAEEKCRIAEEANLAAVNKAKHMDTLTKQYGELKSQLLEVSKKYDDAQARIVELEAEAKTPKKVINTKSSSTPKATVNKPKEPGTDDF